MSRFFFAALAFLLVASQTRSVRSADKEAPKKVSKELRAIAKSNNQFAFDLYSRLGKGDGNLFFSPTSISTALAMTYAGAEGTTEKEIAGVLRLTLPESEVHPAYASLMATLNAAKNPYELRIANRLWGQTGYCFLPDFIATTDKHYGAKLAQVDFVNDTEKSRREINAWVEKQTNNKIANLLPQGSVTDMTRLVLTNAIYFKGKWSHEFDKKVTKNAPFTVSPQETVDVPLMFQKRRFKYGETVSLQLLEIGYKGDDLSMLILLPKKADGLPMLEKDISADNVSKWSSSLRMQEVQTYLPRFKLTQQFSLNSVLAELGMPSAFDPGKADFSGMNGKRDLSISAAIHKAFVDVNEEGTEAAAATGIVVGVTSLPAEPKVFRADHPFVFMIRDNRTDCVLFLGRVVNPSRP